MELVTLSLFCKKKALQPATAAASAVLDGLEFADFIFSSKSELNGLQGILSPCHGFFWHQAQCTERKNKILLLKNLTLNADENI